MVVEGVIREMLNTLSVVYKDAANTSNLYMYNVASSVDK